ncbi:MAG: methyltransferase [Deltaproteobacteria bacterium]|nr:methyltransferase [Deltaproteobacteria bacterium]
MTPFRFRRRRAIGTPVDLVVGKLLRPVRKAMGARLAAARRHRRTVVEYVDGLPVIVLPDVFNPVLFRSGALLARTVREVVGSRPRTAGPPRLLDLGTGSGVVAVFAAMGGAKVEAVDLNPQAVRCTQLNAQLHHLDEAIDVREGDLFAPVTENQYDLVAFNPPFYRARPETFLEAAYRSEDLFERFAAGLRNRLAPGGQALVVLSTEGDCENAVRRLRTSGFLLEEVTRTRWYGELLVVLGAKRP